MAYEHDPLWESARRRSMRLASESVDDPVTDIMRHWRRRNILRSVLWVILIAMVSVLIIVGCILLADEKRRGR
jgi:signal transduction histidine kinase